MAAASIDCRPMADQMTMIGVSQIAFNLIAVYAVVVTIALIVVADYRKQESNDNRQLRKQLDRMWEERKEEDEEADEASDGDDVP